MKAQVIANSGQLPGESWQDFAARRAERDKSRAQKEDANARNARLQREKVQSKFPNPGKKGPTCFQWVLTNGFRVRTPVTRAEAQDLWSSVPDSHKRYDSFRNEWDINEAFDPKGKGRSEDDDFEDYDDNFGFSAPNAAVNVGAPTRDNSSDNAPDTDQQAVHDNLVILDASRTPHHNIGEVTSDAGQQAATLQQAARLNSTCDTESLDQLLSFRYGFVLPDVDFINYVSDCPVLPWDKVRAILGDMESPLEGRYTYPVTVFLGCFLSTSVAQMLPNLRLIWDLHEQCPLTIHDYKSNSSTRFTVITCSDGRQCYRLRRSNISPSWDLILEQATDVLECLRRSWGPDAATISEAFLARGIPFRTLAPVPPTTVAPPLDNNPVNPVNRELAADYTLYERRLREFLCGPRGRAALMQGGIAWRLARDVLGNDVVMAGPSPLNCQSWMVRLDGSSRFYDDVLSEDEEYILCGGHDVKGTNSTTVLYWFPRPSVWNSCGLNHGYWAEMAEEWMTRRRGDIRNGVAEPRTNTHWKNSLARFKQTKAFVTNIERAAARYISGERFY